MVRERQAKYGPGAKKENGDLQGGDHTPSDPNLCVSAW